MDVPYESTGRTRQKERTRAALLTAARDLLADGATPTVEQTADTAGISRTTAYRYFSNQQSLLLAAIPDIGQPPRLDPADTGDVSARLDRVIAHQTRILRDYEPQLRTALKLSLDQTVGTPRPDRPVLRRGRAVGWIRDALAPLADTHPHVDRARLAITIRATCGIEAWIWLVDIAGISRRTAATLMRDSAQALLEAALRRA